MEKVNGKVFSIKSGVKLKENSFSLESYDFLDEFNMFEKSIEFSRGIIDSAISPYKLSFEPTEAPIRIKKDLENCFHKGFLVNISADLINHKKRYFVAFHSEKIEATSDEHFKIDEEYHSSFESYTHECQMCSIIESDDSGSFDYKSKITMESKFIDKEFEGEPHINVLLVAVNALRDLKFSLLYENLMLD